MRKFAERLNSALENQLNEVSSNGETLSRAIQGLHYAFQKSDGQA